MVIKMLKPSLTTPRRQKLKEWTENQTLEHQRHLGTTINDTYLEAHQLQTQNRVSTTDLTMERSWTMFHRRSIRPRYEALVRWWAPISTIWSFISSMIDLRLWLTTNDLRYTIRYLTNTISHDELQLLTKQGCSAVNVSSL